MELAYHYVSLRFPCLSCLQKKGFVEFAKVHPAALWYQYKIDPDKYRTQIGVLELACATFLVFGPRPVKMLCCLILSSIMFGAMFSEYMIGKNEKVLVPAIMLFLVFLKIHFLLTGTGKPKTDQESKKER